MKILIVSGFLGAGKTTFIKELSKRTGAEIAILENEYASVGVDRDTLIKGLDDKEINIWELTEGCICCSTKQDFAKSILTIANSIDPAYLVVEPTGVGRLGSIIENIKQLEYERISLLAPLAIVDGYSFDRYSMEYEGIFYDQLRNAHMVLVSKFEDALAEDIICLESKLRKVTDARIVSEHYTKKEDAWWQDILSTKLDGTKEIIPSTEADIVPDTFSLSEVGLENPLMIPVFLENLIRGIYGNIIRAKGSLLAGGIPILFDVADGRYSILFGEADSKHTAVFIGHQIKRQKIRKIFHKTSKYVKIRV